LTLLLLCDNDALSGGWGLVLCGLSDRRGDGGEFGGLVELLAVGERDGDLLGMRTNMGCIHFFEG